MDISRTSDVWWKNAIFYCLDVETYQDSGGDGVGDFRGLAQRVDHLAGLGVTCVWLMPFYPSPNRDDGYDITDYYSVDPVLGSLGDFVEFVRTARDRGIRVIADLVVNHTSREHPWFQSARSDPASPYRDWYVWSDTVPEGGPDGLIFPGVEDSNWAWDEAAQKYYLHRFYRHQPDLNIANPEVREEIRRIVGFWLELGLSGFRVDAVPFLIETSGLSTTASFAPHEWLRELRQFVGRRRGDAMLLGEVNLPYQEVRRFFGDESGGELHMCLDFNLNQALALSVVREDAGPLVHTLRSMPDLPPNDAWAQFVRNHDEWSLDKLTEAERQDVFRAFGNKPEMQIFGRGLRRRIPTMMGGDEDRIRLIYSLAFSLPGAPVLYYGEEIGMAENLEVPGRQAVRVPMQWSGRPNAGFSTADPDKLVRPIVTDRKYAPKAVNVADQQYERDSMLNWMEQLIRRRRKTPEIVFGTRSFIPVPVAQVFAVRYDWGERSVLLFHNLGQKPVKTEIEIEGATEWEAVADLFGEGEASHDRKTGKLSVALPRYGHRWLRVQFADCTDAT